MAQNNKAAEYYRRVTTRQLTLMSIFGVDPLAEYTNFANTVLKAYFLKLSKEIFWNLGFLFNFFSYGVICVIANRIVKCNLKSKK